MKKDELDNKEGNKKGIVGKIKDALKGKGDDAKDESKEEPKAEEEKTEENKEEKPAEEAKQEEEGEPAEAIKTARDNAEKVTIIGIGAKKSTMEDGKEYQVGHQTAEILIEKGWAKLAK